MTISEQLREHALAGTSIYNDELFSDECFDALMLFLADKDEINQNDSDQHAAVACLYMLFVAEALES